MESDLIECLNLQMLNKYLNTALFLLFGVFINAQLPSTNIYKFTMTKSSGKYSLKDPQILTEFNMDGYNNQPYFFNDNEIYFTTNYYGGEQTEVAKFDLFDRILTRITYTLESEYSPTPMPGKESFSCVRVESDGRTQTLSIYPLDGIGIAKRYMNNTSNIGYHNWINEETLALFLVEAPDHNLAIADALSERRKIVLDKIGRTLKVKNGQLFFIHKQYEDVWYIKSYDYETNKSKLVATALPGVEDFEVLNDGSLLSAQGSKLFHHKANGVDNNDWVLVKDMEAYNIKNITRIAARKNKLVFVNQSE